MVEIISKAAPVRHGCQMIVTVKLRNTNKRATFAVKVPM